MTAKTILDKKKQSNSGMIMNQGKFINSRSDNSRTLALARAKSVFVKANRLSGGYWSCCLSLEKSASHCVAFVKSDLSDVSLCGLSYVPTDKHIAKLMRHEGISSADFPYVFTFPVTYTDTRPLFEYRENVTALFRLFRRFAKKFFIS